MSAEKSSSLRNRTIRWLEETDGLAQRLAAERGYFPEKANGGVSKFLADLVLAENQRAALPFVEPSPRYREHIRQAEQLRDDIKKKGGK